MHSGRLATVVAACAVALLAGRQSSTSQPTFRVAVDVVSIDAVVTDDRGRAVRDLTADDFEVLQNGRRQNVTSATFIPVASTGVPAAAPPPRFAPPARSTTDAASTPSTQIVREQVGRTIVVVVDDLGLSGQGLLRLLPALRRFVGSELLTTDAVAIVRTGEMNGLLQSLTRDRDALLSAVDALRYNTLSRRGPSAGGDVVQLGNSPPQFDGAERPLASLESLSALHFVVRAARDLPGRKTVVIASEGFQNLGSRGTTGQDSRVRNAIERVTDQAVRSGVVLYALDCTGLETGGLRASDDIHYVPDMTKAVGRFSTERLNALQDAQQSLAYLTEQTGGFAVVNTNDLAKGLARIGDDIRDYYIIGYTPEPETFAVDSRLARQHSIAVKVKRPGMRIRTRRGFTGTSDPPPAEREVTPAQALVRAAMSPFSETAIGVQATSLPGYWPDRGLFVRTVLHLDASALTFQPVGNGAQGATVDLVGLVFDTDGAQVHDMSTGFDVTLASDAVARVAEDGLVYVARIPISKPGGYQLRFALRDRHSGRIGTGGGFVAVPDVTGGALALSGVVLRSVQGTASPEGLESDRFSVAPRDARRVFAHGATLAYAYQVYNGRAVRAGVSLWRGERRVMEAPAVDLVSPPAGIPATAEGRLTLDPSVTPGSYVLQVTATATDGRLSNRASVSSRTSFDVK